ncbi:terpenoid cyclases/Protein prenyltransferase [Lindgomyces ingoldianus]|uniref:Terpenoid cyclases/Protein prenyltransferase n=1 Tax=Lindgomyces ingoldianus TaxID=673940 RepID=A0ACB6R655_9PLEO|nr:terpenoid cyclases/Protein prenyltransferase [Lindgomyces ingoldianus]KAF2474768.1 terpenoid cyclases/Protein prenyltransferase [Lindgomyces ingoldianus]
MASRESTLYYSKHINYWRRNLKTFLPHHYTGNDSNRIMLAYFILSAVDLLGDLPAALSSEERQGHIEWIYRCQLPEGGFRGSPGTDFGSLRKAENAVWDPATVPATFFAISILAILGDNLRRVKRRETLSWLNKMQRHDGSFGETLGLDGRIEGGHDTRFGYTAAGIRWMLRGTVAGPIDEVPDIDVDKFVECLRNSETYDGGISEDAYHEAHSGYTCCAVSALSLIDRLPLPANSSQQPDDRIRGIKNPLLLLRWLVSRQTLTIEEDDALDAHAAEADSAATTNDPRPSMKLSDSYYDLSRVGLNGRANKIGDTCYAYWSCAPLKVLGHLDLVDGKPIRRWLLDKTQHLVGGFGKLPGHPPDIYHSYLGLAILSIFGEPGLKDVDAALCISNRAKAHLESLPWRKATVGDAKQCGMGDVPQEILFDPAAREEYLTGFHKRKLARAKHAQEEAAKKEKEERLRLRRELRKQRKEDLERHVSEVNALLRKATDDPHSDKESPENTDSDDNTSEEEWEGLEEPVVEDIDREDEYIDEDKYTTVTIESVQISKHGFQKTGGGGADSGEQDKENGTGEGEQKKTWAKERPKVDRPKKKKKKFRYESKAERKVTRMKQGAKNRAQASARKGK